MHVQSACKKHNSRMEAQGLHLVLLQGNEAFAKVFETQSALGTNFQTGQTGKEDLKNYVPLKSLRVINLPDVVPRVRPAVHLHAPVLCCFCAHMP